MSPRLQFAIETAILAGRSTLAHFQSGTAVDLKEDSTPVTVADRDAERLIRTAIGSKFPEDGILGEEEGESGRQDRRWVIDPIDGTKSFVAGVPLYATLIAFESEGEAECGICYFPALNELVYAEKGFGASWNGRTCRVSDRQSLTGSIVVSGSMKSMEKFGRAAGFADVEGKALACRTWGDAYGHALVATGRAELMVDPVVARWDVSAMSVIVREAGGRFTDFAGGDTLGNEALSSNGNVHREALEAFRD
jgi:histidinol-phosphatase